jgi:hypothetical protein
VKRLAAVLLCIFPAYAEPPFLPIANCEGDVCTMKRADFVKFQQFHSAVYAQFSASQEAMEMVAKENADLRNKLSQNVHCQLRKI